MQNDWLDANISHSSNILNKAVFEQSIAFFNKQALKNPDFKFFVTAGQFKHMVTVHQEYHKCSWDKAVRETAKQFVVTKHIKDTENG